MERKRSLLNTFQAIFLPEIHKYLAPLHIISSYVQDWKGVTGILLWLKCECFPQTFVFEHSVLAVALPQESSEPLGYVS